MKTAQSKTHVRNFSLLRSLSLGGLGLAALGALWTSYRAHRTVREMQTPAETSELKETPHVSIILPVRNEEANIDGCLTSLLAQDYPDFEIMVIDDESTDNTPALLAAWQARDPRIRVQRIDELPAGWTGKAHALHTGVMLTQGEWLVFTDADTRHAPQTLRLMLAQAQRLNCDLLSILMTHMELTNLIADLLTPTVEILLALLASPSNVRDPAYPLALAMGQYMLIRRSAYQATGGYGAPGMGATFTEDFALAQQFKRHGLHVEVVNARDLLGNRQWTTWQSAWLGLRKSCYGEIVRSRLLWLGAPAAVALTAYGLGPLLVLLTSLYRGKVKSLATLLAALTVAAQVDAKRCFDREHRRSLLRSLTAPLSWAALGGLLLDTTLLILSGHGARWKGRALHPAQERSQARLFSKERRARSDGRACREATHDGCSSPPGARDED